MPVWTFRYNGQYWVPSRDPAADENLLLAVETLALSFRFKTWQVQDLIDAWNEAGSEQAGTTSVGLTTVTVKRVNGDLAEIRDKYGQFQNVRLPGDEFEAMLRSLVEAIGAYSSGG